MSETATTPVTQLLQAWRAGDQAALDQLLPLVHTELHSLARRMMSRENPGHTWQTTELVNEAYLRLVGQSHQAEWQDRAHFFAVASQVMRHLLVDHARTKQAGKHGGAVQRMALEEAALVAPERSATLLALDEALDRLAGVDAQKSRIVELRYFGGLTVDEVADVLGIAAITVKREWARAKLWLHREMQTGAAQ
ncbi:MAG: sigma-70 family RNA polymerase sigma factor [Acidobacteria bacterium]|nr:sigma-70 family RNA polymerase sigma factor [Acidobacteriota bacterium]MBI3426772.1 sigma-70 family RNA polymerase sigma factor [Acidobacteriota bacterium]